MMEAAGRLDELLIINFEFPEMSHTYNPFFSGGVRATISTAMKLQANSKEEFWTDIARYSLTAAVLSLKLQPGEPVFHIKDIIAVLSDFDLLLSFIRNIRVSDSIYHSDGVEWLHSYLRFWFDEEKQVWNLRGYKQLLQGLVSKLSAFAHPNTPASSTPTARMSTSKRRSSRTRLLCCPCRRLPTKTVWSYSANCSSLILLERSAKSSSRKPSR